jgi:hypothetical protein
MKQIQLTGTQRIFREDGLLQIALPLGGISQSYPFDPTQGHSLSNSPAGRSSLLNISSKLKPLSLLLPADSPDRRKFLLALDR